MILATTQWSTLMMITLTNLTLRQSKQQPHRAMFPRRPPPKPPPQHQCQGPARRQRRLVPTDGPSRRVTKAFLSMSQVGVIVMVLQEGGRMVHFIVQISVKMKKSQDDNLCNARILWQSPVSFLI